MSYKIVRETKSGGGSMVGLTKHGRPRYVYMVQDAVYFVEKEDAKRY